MSVVQEAAQWLFMAALAWIFRPRAAKCAPRQRAACQQNRIATRHSPEGLGFREFL
jgi:hypothetical protein